VQQTSLFKFVVRSETEELGVRIYRADLPSFENIDEVTHPLVKLAAEYGGEYDGRESAVVQRTGDV